MKLGIDQSLSKTALVLSNNDNKIIALKLIKTTSSDSTEKRIKHISDEILNFIKLNNIDFINIESLPYSTVSRSVRPLAGLYYYIMISLMDLNITVNSIEPTKLKKFATNKGNASKQEMIEALPQESFNVINTFLKNKKLGLDDLADAYFLSVFKE